MNSFALEAFYLGWAAIGKHQVADIDVSLDAGVIALINEPRHRVDTVEEAETERFQFERDMDALLVPVIPETAAGFERPGPLCLRRNDFALPDVFSEHEQD